MESWKTAESYEQRSIKLRVILEQESINVCKNWEISKFWFKKLGLEKRGTVSENHCVGNLFTL